MWTTFDREVAIQTNKASGVINTAAIDKRDYIIE